MSIGKGLIKIKKKEINAPATQIPEKNVAFAAGSVAFLEFPLSNWEKLEFLNDTLVASKARFYCMFERHIKLDHIRDVGDKIEVKEGPVHPNISLIEWSRTSWLNTPLHGIDSSTPNSKSSTRKRIRIKQIKN